MIRFTLVITALFFTLSTFAKGDGANVEIKGKLDNAEGKTIYLECFLQGRPVTLDSSEIKKNGKYQLEAKVTETDFYRISLDESNFVLAVLSPDQTIELNGDGADLNKSYTVSGSHETEQIKRFVDAINGLNDKNVAINAKYNNPNTTAEEKKELKAQSEQIINDFVEFRDKFINENYNNLAALTTLAHLNDVKDFELIKKIEQGIAANYPDSKFQVSMSEKVKQIEERIKQEEEAKKMLEATQVGKVAPELNFKSPKGEVITLESLRGNYILIDFWASWCGPCRRENPTVVKAYEKYKDKGFTVYSVSLDKSKARWEQAIEADGLIWPNHVSDLKQWQSAATKIYGVRSIPHTVLIDPKGVILEKNLRGPALEARLEEIFGF